MYILTEEPGSGQQLDAFNAIDDVYGTDVFSANQAVQAIAVGLECEESEARTMFSSLLSRGYISEVE